MLLSQEQCILEERGCVKMHWVVVWLFWYNKLVYKCDDTIVGLEDDLVEELAQKYYKKHWLEQFRWPIEFYLNHVIVNYSHPFYYSIYRFLAGPLRAML